MKHTSIAGWRCLGSVSPDFQGESAATMALIDLSFVLVGTAIPLDHGYCLFSALCRIVPELHGDRRIGVHPIRGRQSAPGVLSLTERSRLKVRLPAEGVAAYIAIAGQALDLEGRRVRWGSLGSKPSSRPQIWLHNWSRSITR